MFVTYVLLLDEQVDGGKIVPDVLGDDLRLDLVDPAVDVVAALLVQDVTVRVKQFLSLLLGRVLQVKPLLVDLIKLGLNDGGQVWPLAHQLFSFLHGRACVIPDEPPLSTCYLRRAPIEHALSRTGPY